MDDVYSEFEQDTAQAQTENDKFQQGDISPDVRDFYNHDAHVKEHNKFRKSETYLQLPDELKAIIDNHVQQHMDFYMQKLLGSAELQNPEQTANVPSATSASQTMTTEQPAM